MEHGLKFIMDNWAVISPVVLLVVSEILSLNPKAQSNGVVQLLMGLLSKKGG